MSSDFVVHPIRQEQAAVEDSVAAYENLLSKLAEVPTPTGRMRQISADLVQITSLRPTAVSR